MWTKRQAQPALNSSTIGIAWPLAADAQLTVENGYGYLQRRHPVRSYYVDLP